VALLLESIDSEIKALLAGFAYMKRLENPIKMERGIRKRKLPEMINNTLEIIRKT